MKGSKARATLKNISEGQKLILANCKTQSRHDQNNVVLLVGSGSETHERRRMREREREHARALHTHAQVVLRMV